MKLKRRRRAPDAPPQRKSTYPTIAVHRNLQLTRDGLWAWFVLKPQPWHYRSIGDRQAVWENVRNRWAELVGHRVQIRTVGRPLSHFRWAQRLDKSSPHRIDDGWTEYLAACQGQIIDSHSEIPGTYLGVRIGPPIKVQMLTELTREGSPDSPTGKVRETINRITRAVGRAGFEADRMSAAGQAWLAHASIGLGAPVASAAVMPQDGFTMADLDGFTGSVRVTAGPLDRYVTVRALRDGREHIKYVAILTVAELAEHSDRDPLDPAVYPFMAEANRFSFPVQWSVALSIVGSAELRADVQRRRRRAEYLEGHYRDDHDEKPPAAVLRSIHDAERVEDEVVNGDLVTSTRGVGVWRLAIAADNPAELSARVEEVVDRYRSAQKITLDYPYGQYELYREFWPGNAPNPMADRGLGYVKHLPTGLLAAAMPNVETALGDSRGPYLGYSLNTSARPVFYDGTYGPENNKSGLTCIVATLGGGKSVLGGVIVESMVRRGYPSVIFDPAGRMGALTELEHLAPFSKTVDLSGARPGTLNPYLLVPDPDRRDYPNDQSHREALFEANTERIDLMVDTLSMLIPQQEAGPLALIEQAVTATGGSYGTNPWRVVNYLDGHDMGEPIANALRAAAQMKGGRLIFPEDQRAETVADEVPNNLLTVFTMRGLTAPVNGVAQTRQERMTSVVLHLAARFATRLMYADTDPKAILLDEAAITGAVSSGRALIKRLAADSRKWHAWVGVLAQNPSTITALGAEPGTDAETRLEMANLVGSVFIGRLSDQAASAAALRLAGIPTGMGYERDPLGLAAGEFLLTDFNDNTGKLAVDLAHRPDLQRVLYTTPSSTFVDDGAVVMAEVEA